MNTIDRLVMMANQIAINLETDSNPVAAMAEHLRLFWDPRMKAMIAAHDGTGLSATAAAAIAELKAGV
jgi:formate dehydrogenase subunit delta